MSHNYILSPSETIHFHHEGELLFDELLTQKQLEDLLKSIEEAGGDRDLFLRSESLRKFYSGRLLRALVTGLFPKRPIRIGFDMLLQADQGTTKPLGDLTCINGIEVGCLIDLTSGTVTVLSTDKTVEPSDSKRLFIGLANELALYKLNEDDSSTHTLKNLGYGFGDRLKSKTHPIIQRM